MFHYLSLQFGNTTSSKEIKTMEDNNKREYDAVLGGQAPPPVNGVVLGGIEGVRRRLGNGDVNVRVEAVLDALTYKKAGLNLVMRALQTDSATVEDALHEYILSIYAKQKYISWLHVEQKDYHSLEESLALADWRRANNLTGIIINKIIDEERQLVQENSKLNNQQKFQQELFKRHPNQDFIILDLLWLIYSKGKFGLSTQVKVWQKLHQDENLEIKDACFKFCDIVGWKIKDYIPSIGYYNTNKNDFIYDISAPEGHLPHRWLIGSTFQPSVLANNISSVMGRLVNIGWVE